MRKSRIFIASSVESLHVAEAVNANLDHDFEVTIWKNGTFGLTSNTVDDLVKKSSVVDFAIFIFTPDDLSTIRNKEEQVVRDNVLFELGLFIGAIGKNRCFLIKPRGEELHLPTDLLGVNPADYDSNRSDNDLFSATNMACAKIKSEINQLGNINHVQLNPSIKIASNPQNYEIHEQDLKVLACCLESKTNTPNGLALHYISHNLKPENLTLLSLNIVKLERIGLIEKSIQQNDYDGGDYFAYSITTDGIDALLKNESIFYPKRAEKSTLPPKLDLSDEPPF
ncbi:TIR domain-containing protein [Yersinia enterocolitica]